MTQSGELSYRRVHRASRELLFDCLTQPEHLTRFWGPDGTTTPTSATGGPKWSPTRPMCRPHWPRRTLSAASRRACGVSRTTSSAFRPAERCQRSRLEFVVHRLVPQHAVCQRHQDALQHRMTAGERPGRDPSVVAC